MKIMVAGGAGYIGSVLVPILAWEGHDVTVFDLLWFGNHLSPPSGFKVVERDLMGIGREHLRGFDVVVFLAGLSNDPMAGFDPILNYKYNAALPAYLAYEAKVAGVRRFVYAGTCSVYGYEPDVFSTESSVVRCSYPYGISKFQGEVGCMMLADDKFSVIALRQGTVCGWSPRMRFDLVVNTMFKNAVRFGKITVDDPDTWRPIIDVGDTSLAFTLAVNADMIVSGVFNVAFENFKVLDIAMVVKDSVEHIYKKSVRIDNLGKQGVRSYKVSCREAKKTLGFNPTRDIDDMVCSIANHFGAGTDFDCPEYHNIEVFKRMRSCESPRLS